MLKTANGQSIEQPSLHNIFKLETDTVQQINIFAAIEELKKDPSVIYAEPNFIYSIVNNNPVSPELSESGILEWLKEHPEIKLANRENSDLRKTNKIVPNDPLYSQQYYIGRIEADAVWDSTKGDTTQVIAILDTGVDWLHPDLKNKIWINKGEIPNNGTDDDGDGFIDDLRGWDFVNSDNNPRDDNSHGTHVAGIAAAETNNGIGIAGVDWNAKILPVKVFQSNGRGDAGTITQGIVYAKNRGATVINMSFGGYSRSFSMENALINASASALLVAAAGNDKKIHLSENTRSIRFRCFFSRSPVIRPWSSGKSILFQLRSGRSGIFHI